MSLVNVSTANNIAYLCLDRPEKLNALSSELIENIISSLEQLKKDAKNNKHLALIVHSSTPKAFCAGADLAERLPMSVKQVQAALDRLRVLMDSMAEYPLPTIACLEGIAFGGGLELALACDFRIASLTALVGLTETRLAIIPGAGGTQRLARLVGTTKAKEFIYTAARVPALKALEVGLVDFVVEAPLAKAKELASEIAKASPLALKAAKNAIDFGEGLPLAEALDVERRCYENYVLNTKDRVEALRAFSEKKKFTFTGS